MTPQEFVNQVRVSIINENSETYRGLLESTRAETATDAYWRSLLELHDRLSATEKQTLYSALRQVAVDTISNIFAVLDGSTRMNGQTEDVELIIAKTGQRLHGDLQELLLMMEERDSAQN